MENVEHTEDFFFTSSGEILIPTIVAKKTQLIANTSPPNT